MSRGLARSAGLIGVATLTSRVLGLVRDMVQSWYFGTSHAADAFTVATRIPTLLRDLFAEGAMSAAFVPTFTRTLQTSGRPAAWRLGSQVVNALLIVTGAIVVAGVVFAGPLVSGYAGPYADTPGKLELTEQLTRINMPFLLLVAVAAAYMGMLNALRRFFLPATSPALYNVVFIACTVVLVPVFRQAGVDDVMALSAGMLLGGVAQIVAQWPALRQEGYRHEWRLNPRDPNLREMLALMGPGTLGAAAAQINLLVATALATAVDGAATALSLAFRLMYMPIGIIGVSVATAAVPEFARQAATDALPAMRDTLSRGVRLMLMLSVPATVGLMVLAGPIVALVFERGAFGDASTVLVATALLYYAPGIVGYSLVKIASPGFYSLGDARTPVIVSVASIVLNLILNLWLNAIMGFPGLALGTSIAANLNGVVLLVLLARRIGGGDGPRVTRSMLKITAASGIMGAAVYGTELGLEQALPGAGLWLQIVRVFGSIAAGLGTLALAAWLLRVDEFTVAARRVLGRGKLR
jgi:putative peptidoglycan lipid II flippase